MTTPTDHRETEHRSAIALETKPILYGCLFYRNAPAAIEWLEQAFGFETRYAMTGPENSIVHSELTYGSCVIMVSTEQLDRGWVSPIGAPGVTMSLCLTVDDPDAHHARAVAAGAEILFPLKDESYGSRGYTCRDPEGQVWSFGTYVPGAYWDGKKA
jgi:uncharacterized glyoxalase superfamily protein PhnB